MRDWIDGAGVCAWLEQYGLVLVGKNVQPWRRGACVDIWRADYHLTKNGVHLSELPDWVWVEKQDSCEIDMAEVQAAAIASLRRDERPFTIARRWNLPRELVESWAHDEGIVIVESLYVSNETRRKRYGAMA